MTTQASDSDFIENAEFVQLIEEERGHIYEFITNHLKDATLDRVVHHLIFEIATLKARSIHQAKLIVKQTEVMGEIMTTLENR